MPAVDPLYASPSLLPSDFTSDFRFHDHYSIIAACILFCHLCSFAPVSCSCLILPRVPLFKITCYISTCSSMPVPTTQFSMHVYDSILSIHMCLSLLATWLLLHHSPGEYHLTPLDSHVQVLEFGACGFSQLLIRVAQLKRGSLADRPEPYPFGPLCVFRVFLL